VEFEAEDQFTNAVTRDPGSRLSIGGQPITGDSSSWTASRSWSEEPARFSSGIEGIDSCRISTNVLRADGSRAVGTYLPSTSEVTRSILREKRTAGGPSW